MDNKTDDIIDNIPEYYVEHTRSLTKTKKIFIFITSCILTIICNEVYIAYMTAKRTQKTFIVPNARKECSTLFHLKRQAPYCTAELKGNAATFDNHQLTHERNCAIVIRLESMHVPDFDTIMKINAYTFAICDNHPKLEKLMNDIRLAQKEVLIYQERNRHHPLQHVGYIHRIQTAYSCAIVGYTHTLQHMLDRNSMKSIQTILQQDNIKNTSMYLSYRNLHILDQLDLSSFNIVPLSYYVVQENA